MKKLLTTLFTLLTITTFSQTVDLHWKIGENEKLNYRTVMADMDSSKFDVNFGDFFKSFSDSTAQGRAEAQDFLKKLNQSLQNIDMVSTLSNKGGGIIEIVMTSRTSEEIRETKKRDSKMEEMKKMLQSLNDGIMLRGSVYAAGGIHSFWLKNDQKNLISIFFELPTKPVQIGDTWKLDVNLISNDHHFECDSSYKVNEVTLTDIKKIQDETIAVIKYNIVEYVNGAFRAKFMGGDGEEKTMMKFTHQAIGEFSVDKGRWISYEGIMTLDATGVMTAKKKTKFSLISQ